MPEPVQSGAPTAVPGAPPSKAAVSRLGEFLVRRSIITSEQLEAASSHQKHHGGQFAAALIRLGFISEEDLTAYLHKEYRLPIIDPTTAEPTSDVLGLLPDTFARKHEMLPISRVGSMLTVALADPSNLVAISECKFLTGCDVRTVLAPARALQKAIERHYNEHAKAYTDALNQLGDGTIELLREDAKVDLAELQRATEEAPIVRLVNALMTDAVSRRASDIHIEPYEADLRIRFRIDGVLYDVMQPPPRFKAALTSRIKIMASLDIAERRLPQDGAIKVRLRTGKEVSFRVSSLPTINGEKIVLRVMDKTALQLDMNNLGFEPEELRMFRSAILRPYGMVLITGPTGSGKTTTLYSMLAEINRSVHNISTAEDPVELNMRGINQVQINEEISLTFATALRSFLRQDPDVIMVGEIRDYETAEISVKAALTGHLVLSTLHTNDAPSSVTRLLDMGVEPFLVSSSVALIAAQRLVRTICGNCVQPSEKPSAEALEQLGFHRAEIPSLKLFHGKGCDECAHTGYRGRTALYEVMPMTIEIRDLVVARAHAVDIQKVAIEQGMRTLRDCGIEKVRRHETTLDEVLRVTGID